MRKGNNNNTMEDYIIIYTEIIKKLKESGIKSAKTVMLYCKIANICSTHGFCDKTNRYFSDLLNTTDRSIQRCLRELEDKMFIIIRGSKQGSHTVTRKIYISDK